MTEQAPLRAGRGKHRDWVIQFESQMLVCGVLAKALYGMPDRDWLDMLIAQGVLDSIPFAQGSVEIEAAVGCFRMWRVGAAEGLDDHQFAAIETDYTRLFVGPQRLLAAPWQSVYTNKDRAVFQMETVGVKNWYQRFDLALASEYNEPADHVGLEFSFLARLCELTIAAAEIRDGEQVKRLIDAQRGFIGQHVLRWVPRWADDVVNHAQTDLYRGLAWLARGAISEAASFFAIGEPQKRPSGPFQIDVADRRDT